MAEKIALTERLNRTSAAAPDVQDGLLERPYDSPLISSLLVFLGEYFNALSSKPASRDYSLEEYQAYEFGLGKDMSLIDAVWFLSQARIELLEQWNAYGTVLEEYRDEPFCEDEPPQEPGISLAEVSLMLYTLMIESFACMGDAPKQK